MSETFNSDLTNATKRYYQTKYEELQESLNVNAVKVNYDYFRTLCTEITKSEDIFSVIHFIDYADGVESKAEHD